MLLVRSINHEESHCYSFIISQNFTIYKFRSSSGRFSSDFKTKILYVFLVTFMCATESNNEISKTSYFFSLLFSDISKGQFYIPISLSIKALTKPNVIIAMNIVSRGREISGCPLKSLSKAAFSSLLLFPLF